MKTTVIISDALLKEARRIATQRGTTVNALFEQGLRQVLGKHKEPQPFKMRKVTFKGRGLHPSVQGRLWYEIKNFTYEGSGG